MIMLRYGSRDRGLARLHASFLSFGLPDIAGALFALRVLKETSVMGLRNWQRFSESRREKGGGQGPLRDGCRR